MPLTPSAVRATHALIDAMLACKAGDGRPADDPWLVEKVDRNDSVYELAKDRPVELRDFTGWMDPANFRQFEALCLDLQAKSVGMELALACQDYRKVYDKK